MKGRQGGWGEKKRERKPRSERRRSWAGDKSIGEHCFYSLAEPRMAGHMAEGNHLSVVASKSRELKYQGPTRSKDSFVQTWHRSSSHLQPVDHIWLELNNYTFFSHLMRKVRYTLIFIHPSRLHSNSTLLQKFCEVSTVQIISFLLYWLLLSFVIYHELPILSYFFYGQSICKF